MSIETWLFLYDGLPNVDEVDDEVDEDDEVDDVSDLLLLQLRSFPENTWELIFSENQPLLQTIIMNFIKSKVYDDFNDQIPYSGIVYDCVEQYATDGNDFS